MPDRIPTSADCVVRHLIDRHAAQIPGQTYALFEDGSSWTFAELQRLVTRTASNLQRLGVVQGDYVLSWLPNGPWAVLSFLSLNYIGAVYVPVNTHYRGGLLQHVIAVSGARLILMDHRLQPHLTGIETTGLDTAVVIGGDPHLPESGLQVHPESVLTDNGSLPEPPAMEIRPWHTHAVLFTSGTTGPSKGVLSSYIQSHEFIHALRHIGPGDCNLANLPMYHATGMYAVYSMLLHGGRVSIVDGFHASTFWQRINEHGVTTAGLLGVMMQYLLKQPAAETDQQTCLRTALVVPLDDDAMEFARRFNIDIYTVYNMCEMSGPLFAGPNPDIPGSCGRVRDGVQVRLVDDHDIEVVEDQAGELIVRTDMPWAMSHGYLNDPEATARAWRNGWFHTGDILRRDRNGNYFFVDRKRDTIRRRGENISSFEVESEIAVHADVKEVAVIGIELQPGENEVMAVIAPVNGREINPVRLIEFLQPRLAYFMIPRYVRIIDELPKTPTQKIMKQELRSEGVTTDTWDREAAGVILSRDS